MYKSAIVLFSLSSGLISSSVIISSSFCVGTSVSKISAVLTQNASPFTSENFLYNATKLANDYDLVDFTTLISSANASNLFSPVKAVPVNQTFNIEIAATFCQPENGQGSTVLLATHGIGSTGDYWNSAYKPEQYSFVNAAFKKGYSVFYYNRVGAGHSTKPSGHTIQLSQQVAILSQLAKAVRGGQYTGTVGKPATLVVVGFSFGGVITDTFVATEPTVADGAVFTGLGYTSAAIDGFLEGYTLRIASLQDPYKFGMLDTGYATWIDKLAFINDYYQKPNYEIEAVEFTDDNKAPFGIMIQCPSIESRQGRTVAHDLTQELVSVQNGLGLNPMAQKFTGPVLVVTGEYDFFACAGYCAPGYLKSTLGPLFSGAKSFEVAIHPTCGHSINFNKNATGAYGVITDFLGKNQL